MDICTLIIAQTMTLMGCLPKTICNPIIDDNGNTTKMYCAPLFNTCNKWPQMWYECKKLDGTIYTEPYDNKEQ